MSLGDMLGGMLNGQQNGYPQNNPQNYGQNMQGGYQQGYGQVPPNQGYQQGYNQQQPMQNSPQMGVLGSGQWQVKTLNELYAQVDGSGSFFAKKGAMVGYHGKFDFAKRLLGTNQGNIVGQLINHASRKFTGKIFAYTSLTYSL